MQARSLPLVSLLCLVLTGCSAYTAHPLYTDQDAVLDPALVGTWVPKDESDKGELRVQRLGDHQYTLAVSTPEENSVQTYVVTLVRLGNHLFADMIFDSETVAGKKIEPPVGAVPMHVIARVEVTADQLSYATLDSDAVEKQNPAEATPLKLLSASEGLIITDETDVLRGYITTHAMDRFSEVDQLKRKKVSRQ